MTKLRLPLIALATLGLMGVVLAQHNNGDSVPLDKPGPSNFAQVMEIFSGHCGTSKCHGGLRPKHGLRLDTFNGIRDTVINADSEDQPKIKRVLPGDPEGSYLFLKITKHRRRGDKRIKGKNMPYKKKSPSGAPRLDDAQIEIIESWIRQGAPLQ